MRKIAALFLLLLTLSLTAQNTLQYQLSVGDTFIIQQSAIQNITQDINGTIQEIENNLSGLMSFEVIKAGTETITLEMNFTNLKMLMSSPTLGELSNIDSSSEDTEDMMSLMFKGILNVPVTIVMEKNGKIKSVTGGDKLIESMFKAADITQPEIIEASQGALEKQFGSDALSSSFEQMTYLFPSKKIKIGDMWTNEYKGDMSTTNTWTLNEYNAATFNLSGTAQTNMSSIDESVIMTLSGTQTTTVTGNSKTGLFTEIVVKGDNTGNTLYSAQNMTIPTTIKSTITYKITQ